MGCAAQDLSVSPRRAETLHHHISSDTNLFTFTVTCYYQPPPVQSWGIKVRVWHTRGGAHCCPDWLEEFCVHGPKMKTKSALLFLLWFSCLQEPRTSRSTLQENQCRITEACEQGRGSPASTGQPLLLSYTQTVQWSQAAEVLHVFISAALKNWDLKQLDFIQTLFSFFWGWSTRGNFMVKNSTWWLLRLWPSKHQTIIPKYLPIGQSLEMLCTVPQKPCNSSVLLGPCLCAWNIEVFSMSGKTPVSVSDYMSSLPALYCIVWKHLNCEASTSCTLLCGESNVGVLGIKCHLLYQHAINIMRYILQLSPWQPWQKLKKYLPSFRRLWWTKKKTGLHCQ